jgi:hypothetical protein
MAKEVATVAPKPETNQLAILDQLKALSAPGKYASDGAIAVAMKVGDYLPYVQVCGSNTIECKRGEFPIGHFGLRDGKQLIDLGTEIIILVCAVRAKAMTYDPVEVFFDFQSEGFKNIQAKALSGEKDAGCGFGLEFLIWLATQQKFATYFLGNPTGRNESPNIYGPWKQKGPFVCKQKIVLIETKKYSWHGPKTIPCELTIPMPPMDLYKKELERFNNPPANEKEPVEAAKGSGRE